MAIKLFKRSIRVVVSTIEIINLDMVFKVEKSLKPEPNTAELTIFNLNADHRSALEQMQSAPVQIEAGYENNTSVLFVGDLRTAISVSEGAEIVTVLSSGDGEKAIKKARVKISIEKDAATPDKVLRAVAEALGVGKGNLDQAVQKIKDVGIKNHFTQGVVLCGSAYREMNAVCRSVELSWSIQNGNLQFIPIKQALEGEAIVLSETTGMIGSPTVDNDGVLSAKMLLAPDVFPGRKMVLKAKRLEGQYRIETCSYSGDTSGNDWYIDLTAKRY